MYFYEYTSTRGILGQNSTYCENWFWEVIPRVHPVATELALFDLSKETMVNKYYTELMV